MENSSGVRTSNTNTSFFIRLANLKGDKGLNKP
jgi:hypothetical protein